MKKLIAALAFLPVAAMAQPAPAAPDYQKQALVNEVLAQTEAKMEVDTQLLAAKAQIAALEKQLAARPAPTPAPK